MKLVRTIKDLQQEQYLLGFTTVLVIFENSFKLNSPKVLVQFRESFQISLTRNFNP